MQESKLGLNYWLEHSRGCLMCEPASHVSHAIHASQGASHASHRFNMKNNQIMEIII